MSRFFRDDFNEAFGAHFQRLYRYLDRLSGDPELAADIAQETFVKLYERGALPEETGAWLITVATNMFRNAHTTRERRSHLLKVVPDARMYADRAIAPGFAPESDERARRVRAALERMPERERQMLLLRAEGYSYAEIAVALSLKETSVGTLLARAKRAFRNVYEARSDASE